MDRARGLIALAAMCIVALTAAACMYIQIPGQIVIQPAPTATPTLSPAPEPVTTLIVKRVTPWALTTALSASLAGGDTVAAVYDANAPSSGSLLPLRIDGSGSATFDAGSRRGAVSDVCAEGGVCDTTSCPGSFPDVCGETAPECDGPSCAVETGNLVAYFRDAVDYRLTNTDVACDTFDEAIVASGDGYTVRDECNPVLSGNFDSRVLVLPLVDSFCTPTCSVTIKDFATFWLDGYNAARCSGSVCEINLRFVSPAPAW